MFLCEEMYFNKNLFANKRILRLFIRKYHVYEDIIPWKDIVTFSKYLVDNIVYNNNGLLVINKPYGISFAGHVRRNADPVKKKNIIYHKELEPVCIKETVTSTGVSSDNFTLLNALPYICKELGYEKLLIGRVPEKFISGVAILVQDEKALNRLQESIDRTKSLKDFTSIYHAVVTGCPNVERGNYKFGLSLDIKGKQKHAVLLKKWSINSTKRGEVKVCKFKHRNLITGTDNLSSLLEVSASQKRYHCVRLFLASQLLSPVLGDNLFGGYAKSVMGVKVPVDHWSDTANAPPRLPEELLTLLDLRKHEQAKIPVHLHLSRFSLLWYEKKNEELVLEAPPPSSFQWTCQKLGLEQTEESTKVKKELIGT